MEIIKASMPVETDGWLQGEPSPLINWSILNADIEEALYDKNHYGLYVSFDRKGASMVFTSQAFTDDLVFYKVNLHTALTNEIAVMKDGMGDEGASIALMDCALGIVRIAAQVAGQSPSEILREMADTLKKTE